MVGTFADNFVTEFRSLSAALEVEEDDCPDEAVAKIEAAFHAAALAASIPKRKPQKQRPWISEQTLGLIDQRRAARFEHDRDTEATMQRAIRVSAREDRKKWLCDLAGFGQWSDIQRLRGKKSVHQGRLLNEHGIAVSSEDRPDTFGKYLEQVQWRVRLAAVVPPPGSPLRSTIPMNTGTVAVAEVLAVIRKLRPGKAAGHDDIPPDFWKALQRSFKR